MKASLRMLGFAVAGVFLLGASAARADLSVFATVTKTKTSTIDETITINKAINVTVDQAFTPDAAAEQMITKNQRNGDNLVEDENALSLALLLGDSFASADGVVMINQSPGHANNQANEVSVTFSNESPTDDPQGVYTHAQIDIGQVNGADEKMPQASNRFVSLSPGVYVNAIAGLGEVDGGGGLDGDLLSILSVLASGNPFAGLGEGGSGIVAINQAANSLNNQDNAVAMALGDRSSFALGDLELGQFNQNNLIDVSDQIRVDLVAGGAFNGFSGVVLLNQASGVGNNQANLLDVVGSTTLSVPVPMPNGQAIP
jgi:hypothetical protein